MVDVLNGFPERSRFMKGIFAWVGFRQAAVPFVPAARQSGASGWSFRKLFRFGRYQYSAQADIFNFTNNGYVKSETRLIGTSYGQPLSNLQPRTLRLAVQMRF